MFEYFYKSLYISYFIESGNNCNNIIFYLRFFFYILFTLFYFIFLLLINIFIFIK